MNPALIVINEINEKCVMFFISYINWNAKYIMSINKLK